VHHHGHAEAYEGRLCDHARACAGVLTLELRRRPGGSHQGSQLCKSRRSAATNEARDVARLRANPHESAPLHVHGKEGVDGSSPSEGLNALQVSTLCCLIRQHPNLGCRGGQQVVDLQGFLSRATLGGGLRGTLREHQPAAAASSGGRAEVSAACTGGRRLRDALPALPTSSAGSGGGPLSRLRPPP
jgi:hypothetical protein